MMRERCIWEIRVVGAPSDSQFGAVCVGQLVAIAGRARAWVCGMAGAK